MPKVIFNARKTNGSDAFNGDIIFNEVTLNVGNGMNPDCFVVPITGHYRLSFSAMGAYEKDGTDTFVHVRKNGSMVFQIGDSDNEISGNNISHNWIWNLKKGEKVSFAVHSASYLRAWSQFPVNFNGQLVFVET